MTCIQQRRCGASWPSPESRVTPLLSPLRKPSASIVTVGPSLPCVLLLVLGRMEALEPSKYSSNFFYTVTSPPPTPAAILPSPPPPIPTSYESSSSSTSSSYILRLLLLLLVFYICFIFSSNYFRFLLWFSCSFFLTSLR